MRILVSNDDGVHAAGIAALATELANIGEISVIAPDRNRSGASNSLTIQVPVRAQVLDNKFVSVTGTPTDCVHLGLGGYFVKTFDMVVSGINDEANLGDDVLYSGTVAAAIEGRTLGLPSIAVSLASKDKPRHYLTAAVIARQIIQHLKKCPLPSTTILNVNVPDVPLHEIDGLEVTRLGTRHAAQPVIKVLDPRGSPAYWMGASGSEADAGPGTDFHAIKNNKVSITPLQIDMTNYTAFETIAPWTSTIILCKD